MVGAGVFPLGEEAEEDVSAPFREETASEDLRATCPYLWEDQAPH